MERPEHCFSLGHTSALCGGASGRADVAQWGEISPHHPSHRNCFCGNSTCFHGVETPLSLRSPSVSTRELCLEHLCLQQRFPTANWNLALSYLVIEAGRDREPRCQVHFPFQHLHTDVLAQVSPAQPPVPVVGDVSPVHDLTKEVPEVVPWYLSGGAHRGSPCESPHKLGEAASESGATGQRLPGWPVPFGGGGRPQSHGTWLTEHLVSGGLVFVHRCHHVWLWMLPPALGTLPHPVCIWTDPDQVCEAGAFSAG